MPKLHEALMPELDAPDPVPFNALRRRCRELGMPAWRLDAAGRVLEGPALEGPAGAWMDSRTIGTLVGQAGAAWVRESDPRIAELFPGCWLLPIPERARRRTIGYTAALGLGPTALGMPQFLGAATDAGLGYQNAVVALTPLAVNTEESVRGAHRLLGWMISDLSAMADNSAAISGLTSQLTDSYETIDALYSIGRSISDLTRPADFVTTVCRRLHSTLNFDFIVARFNGDTGLVPALRGKLVSIGRPAQPMEALRHTADKALLSLAPDRHFVILGANSGLTWPKYPQALAQPLIRDGRVVGAIFAGHKLGPDPSISSYDTQMLEAASGYLNAFLDNAALFAEQQDLFLGTIRALTASIDAKDSYTRGHSERVAHMAWRLALATGLLPEQAERVRIAGLVHDVGKIGVPEAVLTKQGRLTEEEFAAIKLHPEIGHRILKDIGALADVLPGVLYHHERFDGRGYPHGLAGQAIPPIARMITLADTFDAMSSSRSYRAAMPRGAVLAEIVKCAGSQFDAEMAKVFVTLDFSGYDRLVAQEMGVQRAAA